MCYLCSVPDDGVCDCCHRMVPRVQGSIWHGDYRLCEECFGQWYDPDSKSVDNTDPISIGNYIRWKHGLPAREGNA